jgi:hypothetical protein
VVDIFQQVDRAARDQSCRADAGDESAAPSAKVDRHPVRQEAGVAEPACLASVVSTIDALVLAGPGQFPRALKLGLMRTEAEPADSRQEGG